jgi:hypothetical protein
MFGWSPRHRSIRVPIHRTIEEFTEGRQPREMILIDEMIRNDFSFFAEWGIQMVVKKRDQEHGAWDR